MATVTFTQNLRRHVDIEHCKVAGETIADVLRQVFDRHPRMRGYLLDDTGAVRKHVAILVDGASIADRQHLTDRVSGNSEVFIMQALSGG